MLEPPLIDIRNATVWRGSTRVFEALNLTIPQHQHVAVLGPNGCGKTTLLKTINRELYPVVRADSWIRVLGNRRGNVWALRRHLGLVSHDLHARYHPDSTASDVVVSGFHASIGVHGLLAKHVAANQIEAAERILGELGMRDFIDVAFRRMSTGQQRRCLLGRALVHDPHTLILDEPTAGLDFAASFDYLHRLRRLARAGRTIVLVTHHLGDIPPEVDRVILLKAGRVVADGPKPEVLTAERLSAVYETAIRVAEVEGFFLAYPG